MNFIFSYTMKHSQYIISVLCGWFLLAPAVHAGYFGAIDTFGNNITGFFSSVLVPLVFAIALLVFLWGMFTYFIAGGGDESQRERGKGLIIWSIIAFVIMVTIWGIVNFLVAGLGAGAGATFKTSGVNVPTVTVP
jgi:hypothetical protein